MGEPSYLGLKRSGLLAGRVERLDAMLAECTVCPHACGIDRTVDLGRCATAAAAVIASSTPHFGEEPVISGRRGSGTVFLANCNLRCVFCQNYQISQRPKDFIDAAISDEKLAEVFLDLERRGCHNLNWVSPSHQVPQLVRALAVAAERGFSLPIVYNSNGYDAVEVVRLLDGVVDVYMPDLKYADDATAAEYSRIPDYPRRARAAIAEMFRQVGDEWRLDDERTLRRGLLIRILVLPNGLADVGDTLSWIADALSPRVHVSLMAQYHPQHRAAIPGRYPLLARTISAGEWGRALEALETTMAGGGHYVQDRREAPEYYLPDFDRPDSPFSDR